MNRSAHPLQSGSPRLPGAKLLWPVDEVCPNQAYGANNLLETHHDRLKARLRPMRGLKRDRTASVIVAGHAFIQNLRRGFYDIGTETPPASLLADAFAELALAI